MSYDSAGWLKMPFLALVAATLAFVLAPPSSEYPLDPELTRRDTTALCARRSKIQALSRADIACMVAAEAAKGARA